MSRHTGRTYVVTGADSGIGAELAKMLEGEGARIVRCGIGSGIDIDADLGTADGRTALVDGVTAHAPDGIDGLALVAGVAAAAPSTVSINYFGTIAVLKRLRLLLLGSRAPRVVVISSASSLSAGDNGLVAAALRDEETAAMVAAERAVSRGRGSVIYRSTKIALNRWVRRNAGRPEWAGSGIALNVVAPGIVETETARRTMLTDSAQAKVLAEALPQPLGFPGPVESIVDAIGWTISPENSFMVGQILFVDGGADANLRGDEPYSTGVSYGPVAMSKMVGWSLVGRIKTRFGDRP